MDHIITSTTILLSLLSLWGIALAVSTITLLMCVHAKHRKCRKEDLFQGAAISMFVILSLGVLVFAPHLIAAYISFFVSVTIGTLFTFVYLTQRQIYHCQAIKKIK